MPQMDIFHCQSDVDECEISARIDDIISQRTELSPEWTPRIVRKSTAASNRSCICYSKSGKKSMKLSRARSDIMDDYENLIKDKLFGSAADLCGIRKQDIESRFQGIKMLPKPEINGTCVSTLQGDQLVAFKIELYPGVFLYPGKIAEMLATRTGFKNPEDRSTIEDPSLPVEVSLEISKRLTEAFWNGQLREAAAESDIPLSERQWIFAIILTMNAAQFVLGHELGHAVHHMAQTELEEEVWSRNNVNFAIENSGILNVVGQHKRSEIEQNWWQEMAADIIGVKLSLQSQIGAFEKIMAYTGAEYMLMLFHYLAVRGPEEYMIGSTRYPSPMVRALALRGYYGNNPPALFQMAELLGMLSWNMFFPDLFDKDQSEEVGNKKSG